MDDQSNKPMPPHKVWVELERYFRSKLAQEERQQIVHVVQTVLAEQPEQDLNDLVIQVTQAVIRRRGQSAGR